MNNLKTLMIFILPWEADNAQEMLKLNGISTFLEPSWMTGKNNSDSLIGSEKLMIRESDFKLGSEILKKQGFQQIKELINGSYIEFEISNYTF